MGVLSQAHVQQAMGAGGGAAGTSAGLSLGLLFTELFKRAYMRLCFSVRKMLPCQVGG